MEYGNIELCAIKKSFGEKQVLDRISFTAEQGEIFGLLGPSGAGKTTLIRIITGELEPDEGRVLFHGLPREVQGKNYQKDFGIMMDHFGLYERFSCYENLKIFGRIYHIPEERIREVLRQTGLEGAERLPASKLSKGMKSRLRLARAFMTDPKILFLDEPTSGLDPVTANAIHNMILAERERGKTVFLTTHSMAEAEKLCQNLVLLHEGRIVEQGAPQQICRRYNHQKKLRIHLRDGRDLELVQEKGAARELAHLIETDQAETIHTTEPNLESVFMELTGRELKV